MFVEEVEDVIVNFPMTRCSRAATNAVSCFMISRGHIIRVRPTAGPTRIEDACVVRSVHSIAARRSANPMMLVLEDDVRASEGPTGAVKPSDFRCQVVPCSVLRLDVAGATAKRSNATVFEAPCVITGYDDVV